MRVFLDTNVIISALVFGGGVRRLLVELLESGYELCTSSYVDDELREKLEQKWPSKADKVFDLYIQMDIEHIDSANEGSEPGASEALLRRDPKDVPVLRDALKARADVLLTGDKDFLATGIGHPMVYSPSMMQDFLRESGIFIGEASIKVQPDGPSGKQASE